jgi:ParB-like chromosome segregation protein Spo0J
MIIKKVKVKDLKEAAYNPRVIDADSLNDLKKSIKEFGYIQPIIWNEKTGNMISGHQRLKVLKEENSKLSEVEVVVVNLPEIKEKAAVIAFNRIQADWDSVKLSSLLNDIRKIDDDFLGLTGFSNNEITNILSTSEHINLPDLHYDGEMGNQIGIRPTLTFYFENQKDYDKVWEKLKKPSGAEPDSKKLLELVKNR